MDDSQAFTVDEYQSIAQEIDERTMDFICDQIQELMPLKHVNLSTLIYILQRLTVKGICTVSEETHKNRLEVLEYFCKNLDKIVDEAVVLHSNTAVRSSLKN